MNSGSSTKPNSRLLSTLVGKPMMFLIQKHLNFGIWRFKITTSLSFPFSFILPLYMIYLRKISMFTGIHKVVLVWDRNCLPLRIVVVWLSLKIHTIWKITSLAEWFVCSHQWPSRQPLVRSPFYLTGALCCVGSKQVGKTWIQWLWLQIIRSRPVRQLGETSRQNEQMPRLHGLIKPHI